MTTTVPPLADSAQVSDRSHWAPLRELLGREPVLLGFTVAAIALGWMLTSNLLYLGGLILAIIWANVAVARRRRRWLLVLAILLVGLGGPCLGVRLAYLETGTAVSSDIDLVYAEALTTHDGVAVLQGQGPDYHAPDFRGLVAVADSGEQVWARDLGGWMHWPVGDGRVVEAADSSFRDVTLIDAQGDEAWSSSLAPDQGGPVAMGGDTVVVQACTGRRCTWTGLDLADGTERWGLTRPPAPAWHLHDAEWWDDVDLFAPSNSSLFATEGESGRTEVREAATGAVVAEVPAGATLVFARDMALVLQRDGQCRAELIHGGEPWATEIDCGLVDQVTADAPRTFVEAESMPVPLELGVLVGDAWWLVGDTWRVDSPDGRPVRVADGAGAVLDVRTGAARNVSAAPRTFGAGVVAEYSGDTVTVLDAEDGARLWSAPLRDSRVVAARGELVVLSYRAPLLLGEVFDPGNRGDTVIEVRDARTGDVVTRVRAGGRFAVAGDRVFIDLDGSPGEGYRVLMRN